MKLATVRDGGGGSEGRLVVVSRDVTRCSDARHVAPTLQAALEDWERLGPRLELVARGVETGGQPVERFHERDAAPPLPGASMRPEARGVPLGPREPIRLEGSRFAVRAGFAVVTGGAPPGTDGAAARLVMLTLGVSAADGAGGTVAFSPVAVTPDELDSAWDMGRLRGAISVERNGRPLGRFEADADFAALVAEAARDGLGDGVILIAPSAFEGEAAPGDALRIEMRDARGRAVFGAIEQRIEGRSGA